mgnify:CR=1 FL=1
MNELENLRSQIDQIDGELKQLLLKRLNVVLKIGEVKKQQGIDIQDLTRERAVLDNITAGLSEQAREYVKNIYLEIIKNSKNLQK